MKCLRVEVARVSNGYTLTPIFKSPVIATKEDVAVIEDTEGVPRTYENVGEQVTEMLAHEYDNPTERKP